MTVYEGPALADTPGIGAQTLGGLLAEVVDRFGPAEALVLDDDLRGGATVRWTYDELGHQARRVGRALLAAGVEPGERVAVVMGNRPEAVASLFGIALAGAVAVPLSTFAGDDELAALEQRAEPVAVLAQARLRDRRFALAADALGVVGTPGWERFLASGDHVDEAWLDARAAAVGPDDEALVIFSSGTTAAPKGVVHAHRAPALQSWLQARIFGRHPGTRMYSALPLFWTAGLNTALGATLAAGGCWVMQEVFEPGAALALLARERVTEPYTLPHQATALAEHPDWATTDLSSLRCVYGKSVFARHPAVDGDPGWQMPVGYGLTEMCAFVTAHTSDTPRARARVGVGRLVPGARLKVGPGGELAVAGPMRMLRYLGSTPEACFDEDGFLPTGDVGHVDDDGIVHYDGRSSELIKTRGANVSPAELEVQLRACPPVKLSRVVGVGDDPLDQQVVACVVTRDGAEATAEDIQAFLRDRVATYKVPRRVLFFADGEIPMTDSDTKVRDDRLLELVQARLDGDR